MTFNPFRSDEDDALDAHLNAWARNHHDHSEPASDLADDAIAFHRWADSARQHDYAAMGPAASVWDTVLARTAPPRKERKHIMSSITYSTPGHAGSVPAVRTNSRSFSSYANIAATVLMVIGLAGGGWFAAMQLNNPGSPDPRLAAVTGTPVADAQTCDVEPMSVDEVMVLVENPYRYAPRDVYGASRYSTGTNNPVDQEYLQVQPMVPHSARAFIQGDSPTSAAMDGALPVLESYLACVEVGTVGQALRFVDPFSIQQRVTEAFPFYRTEEEVRAYVEEWIAEPADTPHDDEALEGLSVRPNPDASDATTHHVWMGMGFNQIIYLGSEILDEEGNVIARYDNSLNLVSGTEQERIAIFAMIHSEYTGDWYVVMGDWPSTTYF